MGFGVEIYGLVPTCSYLRLNCFVCIVKLSSIIVCMHLLQKVISALSQTMVMVGIAAISDGCRLGGGGGGEVGAALYPQQLTQCF